MQTTLRGDGIPPSVCLREDSRCEAGRRQPACPNEPDRDITPGLHDSIAHEVVIKLAWLSRARLIVQIVGLTC